MPDCTTFEVLTERSALDALAHLPVNCFEHVEWVRAVSAARKRPHQYLAVRAVRSQHPTAYLFGAVHRRGGLTVFESMPMGGYGGWVCEQSLGIAEERELTVRWLRQAPWCVVLMTSEPGRGSALPESPAWALPGRLRRYLAVRDFETHILNLVGDDALLLQRARPRARSYLRKVDQLGLSFSIGHRDQLPEFIDLYRRGSLGWKKQPTGIFCDEFFFSLSRETYMDVWIVRREGRPMGAAVFLLGHQEVQYQASGAEKLPAPVSAMDALIWTAARYYRDRGFQAMNMGASQGLDSVRHFKERLGATAVRYQRTMYICPRLLGWLREIRRAAWGP